jgi:hypothetical protein
MMQKIYITCLHHQNIHHLLEMLLEHLREHIALYKLLKTIFKQLRVKALLEEHSGIPISSPLSKQYRKLSKIVAR